MINKANHKRKYKNIEKLKQMGIDCDVYLPVLQDSSEITPKPLEDVVNRCLCTYFAAMASFIKISLKTCPNETHFAKEDLARAIENINKFNLNAYMTSSEKSVFDDVKDLQTIINPLKTEASFVLSWVIGLNKTLHFPKNVCDIFFLDVLFSKVNSLEELYSYIQLRDIEEILDEHDLEYRLKQTLFFDKNNKNISHLVNPDIVWERYIALDWYIGNPVKWDTSEIMD